MRARGGSRRILAVARVGGYLLPLLLWWLAAGATGVGLALPPPGVVIVATVEEIFSRGFAGEVIATVARAGGAIIVSSLIGVPLGMAAARSEIVNALTRPLLVAVRATPFISVILVAVIWFSAGTVPVFVAVLMALPIIVDAARTAVSTVDPALEVMTRVFAFGRARRIIHLWWPGALPGVLGGVRSAAGIVWKVTVAAEVLAVPAAGIGRQMGEARLYLETERVLAWTIVLIVVAGVSDRLVQLLQARSVQRRGRRDDTASRAPRLAADPGAGEAAASGLMAGVGSLSGTDVPLGSAGTLELRDIYFGWEGHRLFEGLSLTFSEGEVTAVLGASGVGKSTLLALCAGALRPARGNVTFRREEAEGHPVVARSSAFRGRGGSPGPDLESPPRVGMIFQEPRLLPWRTAARNVALAAHDGPGPVSADASVTGDAPDAFDGGASRSAAPTDTALHLVGLAGVAGLYPRELSGGMQQRVALARALVRRPEILLVDEPLSGVDPHQRASLAGELRAAISHHRALSIIASHDIELVLSLADRVIVLAGSPVRIARDFVTTPAGSGGPSSVTADELAALIGETRGPV